jgi:hypothetical protein
LRSHWTIRLIHFFSSRPYTVIDNFTNHPKDLTYQYPVALRFQWIISPLRLSLFSMQLYHSPIWAQPPYREPSSTNFTTTSPTEDTDETFWHDYSEELSNR